VESGGVGQPQKATSILPHKQVVETMEFATADATMRGEMTVTLTEADLAR